MRTLLMVLGLTLVACLACAQPVPLLEARELITAPMEIEEGTAWQQSVKAPALAPGEVPVLFVRSRVPTGGGGNFIMRVSVDGAPVRNNWFSPRLLNKQPNFDPPGTAYHFQWYRDTSFGNFSYTWFTVFGDDPKGNWAGTGQDYDYLFSLDGMVSDRDFNLSLEHVFPGLAAAMKTERAPLLVEKLTIGKLPRAQVQQMQLALRGGMSVKSGEVTAQVPAGETGVQAYELTWSGRPEPKMQVTFDRLDGWTLDYLSGGSVALSASVAQRLWRPSAGKLAIGQSASPVAMVLRPPRPITLGSGFDAANFWVYGNAHFSRPEGQTINVTALLEDARGAETVVDLGPIRMGYWMLLHGYIPAEQRAKWQPPMTFKALQLTADRAKVDYTMYLEGIQFYSRNRQPKPSGRPDKPVFPVSDRGLLPTPPAGLKTQAEKTPTGARFTSTGPGGTLVYEVNLEQGSLNGIMARWDNGAPFSPCAQGGVLAEDKTLAQGKLTGSRVERGKLTAQWRAADGKQWSVDYSLQGRSLIVNVNAPGGWSTGSAFGAVAGLPNAKIIEIPYLKLSRHGGMTRMLAGDGLFVSVLPDMYHCDYSEVIAATTPPEERSVALFRETSYIPLTDGKRNDVHDRILITASPEFAEILPNHQNPRSPNIERLAPYMFVMDRTFSLNRWDTLKRYGMDHIIANDFAGIFIKDYSEGFGVRWRPHPDYTIKQVQDAREQIKSLGFMFGSYIDVTDQPPLNEWWDEDAVSLTSQGDLAEAWPGSYMPKTDKMWVLARRTGQKMKELYPPECVYLDVSTNRGPIAMDYEAGYPGAGRARDMIIGIGDSLVETRKWYGSTVSEGIYRWMYAGLSDMDYAQVRMSEGLPLPLDFDLLKLHPYQIGTMMGYGPTCYLSEDELKELGKGTLPAPPAFYKYIASSLAYGHMAMTGYGYFPPMSRFIQSYALMQGLQREYLPDAVVKIEYHDGQQFLPSSAALQKDAHKAGRVRVTYQGGMVVTVNFNPEQEWAVAQDGTQYVLPPWGWVISRSGKDPVLAYSAMVDGKRMDYVQCPEYFYVAGGELERRVGPLQVQGAAWLKRDGDGWLLIPCGKLGQWGSDQRLKDIPADRGTPLLIVDPKVLGLKAAQLTAMGEMGESVAAQSERLEDGRLKITVTDQTRAFRIGER